MSKKIFKLLIIPLILLILSLLIGTLFYAIIDKKQLDNTLLRTLDKYKGEHVALYLSSNSSYILNITGLVDPILNEYDVKSYGYLYIALPETTWILRGSYIKALIYVDGMDVRYFMGFSSFRPPLILLYLNDSDLESILNIEEPKTGHIYILQDYKYKYLNEPIFRLINNASVISLYTGVYSMKLNMLGLYYVNCSKINKYLGLPDYVMINSKERYDLIMHPPIYILLNWETYSSILLISEPIIKGNYYTYKIQLNYSKKDTYYDVLSKLDNLDNRLRGVLTPSLMYSLRMPLKEYVKYIYENHLQKTALYKILYIIFLLILTTIIIKLFIRLYIKRSSIHPKDKGKIKIYRKLIPIIASSVFILAFFSISFYLNLICYLSSMDIMFYIIIPIPLIYYLSNKVVNEILQ